MTFARFAFCQLVIAGLGVNKDSNLEVKLDLWFKALFLSLFDVKNKVERADRILRKIAADFRRFILKEVKSESFKESLSFAPAVNLLGLCTSQDWFDGLRFIKVF